MIVDIEYHETFISEMVRAGGLYNDGRCRTWPVIGPEDVSSEVDRQVTRNISDLCRGMYDNLRQTVDEQFGIRTGVR